jgi:hypothetical protein
VRPPSIIGRGLENAIPQLFIRPYFYRGFRRDTFTYEETRYCARSVPSEYWENASAEVVVALCSHPHKASSTERRCSDFAEGSLELRCPIRRPAQPRPDMDTKHSFAIGTLKLLHLMFDFTASLQLGNRSLRW